MRRIALIPALVVAGAVSACEANRDGDAQVPAPPEYAGVETDLLDQDLVNLRVALRGSRSSDAVLRYADCAAAQYTLIRGYRFARHVRTILGKEGSIWRADAVYTISPALPRGLKIIDAEVVAAECADNAIPMV